MSMDRPTQTRIGDQQLVSNDASQDIVINIWKDPMDVEYLKLKGTGQEGQQKDSINVQINSGVYCWPDWGGKNQINCLPPPPDIRPLSADLPSMGVDTDTEDEISSSIYCWPDWEGQNQINCLPPPPDIQPLAIDLPGENPGQGSW